MTLLLIDANSLIHRCYHALPPFTNPAGEPVGALYGVASILLKISQQKRTDFCAALFDRPEPTFRKEKFSDYKIHRPKTEDELVLQLAKAHDLFEAFSIKSFEIPGYEADDLIGTLATRFGKEKDVHVRILTGDLDSLQLVRDGQIEVETFRKGLSDTVIYDEAEVRNRYGLEPGQLIDYKALVGDPSDNIPGVPNVGPKTASSILQKYGTLDNFFKNGKEEKAYEKISKNKEIALLSRELAEIHCAAPLVVSLEDLKCSFDQKKAADFFQENNFASLLKRLSPESAAEEGSGRTAGTLFDGSAESKTESICVLGESNSCKKTDLQVGYDIKRFFNGSSVPEKYADVKIGLQLLGIETDTWQETAETLFKKILSYEDFVSNVYPWTIKKLKEQGAWRIWEEIELPLIPVLAGMEQAGICVDRGQLRTLAKKLDTEIAKQEQKLRSSIGDINFNSPKQLVEKLNEKFGLKLKSTSADAFARLKNPPACISDLLAYRELFKMKTTYVQSLESLIQKDGKIRPTFQQIGAATGRIACQNPNLQNIPQESSWSAEIRNAFSASPDHSLVACDYSQIELRILASLTKDPEMLEVFRNGKDIHASTAARVFGVPEPEVTKSMRRMAKTLNFGMVYGMGYRAFAQQSGVSADEAKKFIQTYFEKFSTIKKWQESVLAHARQTGMVQNENGRFRLVPNLHSANKFFASEAERAAINMPIQSFAADILKLAMIRTDAFLKKEFGEKAKMILTIHDELIFDVHDSLLQNGLQSDVVQGIKSSMESAYELAVPITTSVSLGKRWGEMEE